MPKGDGKLVAQNKKARHDYAIEETFEAGIVLQGTEIKSVRNARVNLKDSYARIDKGKFSYTICILVLMNKGTATIMIH